jgi:hypothetical protein
MKTSIRILFGACAAALALQLSACDRDEESSRREGGGTTEIESRDLGKYSAIDMRGAGELNIEVGPAESLKIEGSEFALKRLRTEVRDNTLYINSKKAGWAWFGDEEDLKLTIAMPALTSLRSAGAGNIQLSGLNGGEQTVKISGAHNVEASGKLDKITIELDGAGNVDYGNVESQDAKVTVNGAGHILVRATQTLSATMNGVGAIHYEGEPQKVDSSLHGIGTISKK